MNRIRTDLAMEWSGEGLTVKRRERYGIAVTEVQIPNQDCADRYGKPMGRYCTIVLPDWTAEAARCIGEELRGFLPETGLLLTVGLGNREMTPDALGVLTAEGVLVTRHLRQEEGFTDFREVAAFPTGVAGKTGMETAELVGGLVDRLHPAALIAVDALAARSLERLCRTVQISDAGIVPGSGVGNHRHGLHRESLGIPVIAIGVPTVVDAGTLTLDILSEVGMEITPKALAGRGDSLFVTPRDIDAQIAKASHCLAWGLNQAFQPRIDRVVLQSLMEG